MTSIWQQINQANAAVVEQVGQSVVRIYSGEDGIGAGMIWHADGVIVTNAHVVADKNGQRNNLVVALADGTWHDALVIGYDLQKDVAVIRIDADNLASITPQMDVLLQPGHYVLALGHPWGMTDAVTGGVVIGTGDNLPELRDRRNWIALDLKMRPGHSGGPLFNAYGQIVGMNTMIQGPEVSFAIPVSVIQAYVETVLNTVVPDTEAASYQPDDDVTLV